MGKGDKKSRRGKIHIGSHGARRPRKVNKNVPGIPVPVVAEKPAKIAEVKAKKVIENAEVVTETPVETKKTPRKTSKKTQDTE